MQILIVFVVTIIALLWNHKSKCYFELTEELGCHNTEFRLSCAALNANIAIFEATFSQNDSFLAPLHTSCGNPGHLPDSKSWELYKLKDWENVFYRTTNSNGIIEVNLRHAINRRCSGVNYCSFVLSEDFESAARLGPGAVYLRYGCVDDLHITRACNSNIDVSEEGFVRNPGYPGYYIGESSCLWTLRAQPPQRIRISFLDISLRGFAPYEDTCLDWLIVSENGLNLLSTCGDVLGDTLILSDGSALNVSFRTSSKTLFPKRGFFFHYKAIGCPLLQKPQDGYLINRNDTIAHYRCCVGFVFPDTLSRDKILKCYNENTWDGVLLDCVNATELLGEEISSIDDFKRNLTLAARSAMESENTVADIIVPSTIIGICFVGNAFVLYTIYLLKKKLNYSEEMELNESVAVKPTAPEKPADRKK